MPVHEAPPSPQRAFEARLEYAWRVARSALGSEDETEHVLRAALAMTRRAANEAGVPLACALTRATLAARPWSHLLQDDHGSGLPPGLQALRAQPPEALRPDQALIVALCRASPGQRMLVLGCFWAVIDVAELAAAAGESERQLWHRAAPVVRAMDAACMPAPDADASLESWADPGRWGLVRAALMTAGELRHALAPPEGWIESLGRQAKPGCAPGTFA